MMDTKNKRNNDFLINIWYRPDMVASRRRMKWGIYICVIALISLKCLDWWDATNRPVPVGAEGKFAMPPRVVRMVIPRPMDPNPHPIGPVAQNPRPVDPIIPKSQIQDVASRARALIARERALSGRSEGVN